MPLETTHTAKFRNHQCDVCHQRILKGDRYTATKIPPGGELNYLGWTRWKKHSDPTCDQVFEQTQRLEQLRITDASEEV